MAFAPPQVVEAQPRQALPFGIFSALSLRESADSHWANGVEWEAMTCDPVSGINDPNCDTDIEFMFADSGLLGEASGFAVYGSYNCGPIGRPLPKAEEMATAQLLAREEAQVEAQVWGRLAAAAHDVNPGGALDPVEALAALEDWLGGVYGSLGTIHGSRGAATILSKFVMPSGSRLLTKIGTPVIAGGGYPGTSPAGAPAAAGETWVLASPALFGYRGQVFNSSSRKGDLLDRGTNDLYAIAARNYVVGFDPCGVAAVRLNKTCC